ncbi:spore cortex biosynthesis protein YabQ [Pullulanibacillus pueri]|uniref:spore cortex biosynthesis protein YabQ n=1 Tax=Pullulanibacillus pueri TaxID=1437324 RepID=UPI00166E7B71|nr:spore cortex biosynthesis protein YabQ [Pullulanibacillus pueri]MBM7683948.1 spore cortex biosynthesis protein YabQ [Pullulanibacillus pueri]
MTLTEQFSTMIAMTLMGGWIGMALSTYHRLIHPKKKWHWIMIVTDILFWIVQGLLIFYVLLSVNQGEIRFYIFLALACGYAAYKALLETLYERILNGVIDLFDRFARFIKRLLNLFFVQPTYFLLKLLFRFVKMIGRILSMMSLFLLSIILFPFKLMVRWFIPTSWKIHLGQLLAKSRETLMKWTDKFR